VSIPQHLTSANDPKFYFTDTTARGNSNGSVELHSDRSDLPIPCIELMATCHALALIDGIAVGDPLEVEMFRASGFTMTSNGNAVMSVHSPGPPLPSTQYDVLRHFEFTSDRARAGSLIKRPNNEIIYYSKGSPEAILKLVDPQTVPSDIHSTLTTLSKRGLRVLAMSYKVISSDIATDVSLVTKLSQSELEESSIFLGLIFLSNALKAETLSTINALRGADIKCNMITGDHIHTAIAIATDCGLLVEDQEVFIIDASPATATAGGATGGATGGSGLTVSIAATGELVTTNVTEFLNTRHSPSATNPHHHHHRHHQHHTQIAITGLGLEVVKSRHSHLMKLLLESIQVFARMKPSDKQFIVEQLQHLTEKDVKEMFVDEESRSSMSTDNIQISSDLPKKLNHNFRKSMLDDVAVMMDDDGRGDLHVIFCGDG
jgi:magnesium-transporting ATPase (P-type)